MGLFTTCPLLQKLIPAGADAITIGDITIGDAEAADDPGLKAHEALHQAQFNANPFTFWLNYVAAPHYRLAFEAAAYAVQTQTYGPDRYASFRLQAIGYLCSPTYNLLGNGGLTETDITNALDEALAKLGITV